MATFDEDLRTARKEQRRQRILGEDRPNLVVLDHRIIAPEGLDEELEPVWYRLYETDGNIQPTMSRSNSYASMSFYRADRLPVDDERLEVSVESYDPLVEGIRGEANADEVRGMVEAMYAAYAAGQPMPASLCDWSEALMVWVYERVNAHLS